MVFDERVDADTEADKVHTHHIGSSVMAPCRSDSCLQIGQKLNLLKHRRSTAGLEEQDLATIAQLIPRSATQVLDTEKVANAPHKRAGFEERFAWVGIIGSLKVDS